MGPPPRSAVGVVGDWRTAQHHPGDRPGGKSEPDTLEAHPHSRFHCPSCTLPQAVVHPVYHA